MLPLGELHRRTESRRPVQALLAAVHRPAHADFDAAKAFSHVGWKIAIFA